MIQERVWNSFRREFVERLGLLAFSSLRSLRLSGESLLYHDRGGGAVPPCRRSRLLLLLPEGLEVEAANRCDLVVEVVCRPRVGGDRRVHDRFDHGRADNERMLG